MEVSQQCSICLLYCDAAGNRLTPQPRFGRDKIGVPDPCHCVTCQEQAAEVARTGRGCLPGFDRD